MVKSKLHQKEPQFQTQDLTFKLSLIDIKLGIHHVFHLYHDMVDNAIRASEFLDYQRYHIDSPHTIKDTRITPEASRAYFEARDSISTPICNGTDDYHKYVQALSAMIKGVIGLRKFARKGSALHKQHIDKFLEEARALVVALRLTDGETTLF